MVSVSVSDSQAWHSQHDYSDLNPVLHEESPNSLAEILYSDEYKKAIGYLRALMAQNEHSARALAVVQYIIAANPAHYTAWHYRLEILKDVGKDIIPKERWIFNAPAPEIDDEDDENDENNANDVNADGDEQAEAQEPNVKEEPLHVVEDYTWLNQITLDNPKNYQIWHYRQQLCPDFATNSAATIKLYYGLERLIVELILSEDAKNIHTWSHLIWLVSWISSPFNTKGGVKDTDAQSLEAIREIVLPLDGELSFVENLLYHDVYNNSAWSYRHFIISRILNGLSPNLTDGALFNALDSQKLLEKEYSYAQFSISKAPQNESPWNYITALVQDFYGKTNVYKYGVLDKSKLVQLLEDLVDEYVPLEFKTEGEEGADDDVNEIVLQSTFAIETLVELYTLLGETQKAVRALDLLRKYIPIRRGYWNYLQKRLLASAKGNGAVKGVEQQLGSVQVGY